VVACHEAKRKPVTKQDLASTSDAVLKGPSGVSSADDRKKYVVGRLGAPHRTSGGASLWYTAVGDCYYFQMSAEGWTSWGIGATADCERWGEKP
jgi:hypothetical protein